MLIAIWRLRTLTLRRDALALSLSLLDKRVPTSAKLLTAAMLGYAESPIDLVPDLLPLLGFVDDLAVVAGGVSVARALIPPEVSDEHRREADRRLGALKKVLLALGLLGAVWTLFIAWLVVR
jgi:uncharacterized membrane protein YkvA (DUF1232 family)